EAGAGWQVHRSHWVAENAVVKGERIGSAARLTTADGRDLPVSRRYLPDLRKRGLLS
ncbi:LytTR family DNA-binding domain-containing protein, partial [Tritonibacter sp. SIMBA_163]|uniref:LytTR family DNA-binding domain-containing protein n=1 Tax=Tritonibacter sp. SIMBA_163 TaxID=3080868 RepID=UPI00397F0979